MTTLALPCRDGQSSIKEREEHISHQKGDLDVVLCRGNIAHCGVSYDFAQIRLHCYLDVNRPVQVHHGRLHMYMCPAYLVSAFGTVVS